jgi:ankyrin repeat protein
MLLTMRKHQFMQTRVASDDQESLFSLDSDYTRFAFDDELLLSKAYQNSPFRDYVNSKFEHDLAKDVLVPAGNFWEQSLSIRNLSSIAGKNSIRDSKTITLDVYDQSEKLHIQSNRPQPTGDQSSNKDLLEITFPQDLKQTLELDRDLRPKSGGQQLNNEQESEAVQRVDSHFQEYRGKYPLMALQQTSRARSQVNHILGVVNIAFQQSQSRKSALGLLKEGGYDVRYRNCKLDEALRWATWNGHEAAVRLLLEKGADIKATTTNGATALHYAAGNGHEAAVRLLLEKGADITATDKKGATVLHLAACNGHEAAVRLLLEKGADITATDKKGATALHLAACNGHEAAVRLLLDKGADITATDTREGATALHLAACNGHEAAVRLLLDKGADITATDTTEGATALYWAAWYGHEAAVRLLLEKGADIKATTTDGATALHYAADNGHEAAVRLLLEKGADIKATVQDGLTALHFATRGNHKKVMRLLAEKEADIKTEGKDVQRALESNLMPLGRNQPHYAVALCEFEATQHGDLSFRKGDVITITKKTENTTDWWTGKIGNKTGIFPR